MTIGNGTKRNVGLASYCEPGLRIIESVDSISKDERGFPLTQYITNGRISRGGYTFTHFKHHHRVLLLISYSMVPREVKNRHFGFLSYSIFLFIFSSGPTAIVSYLLTLVYMYIRSICWRDVQCANGFSVTRPSLNLSFTIKHTVSLPLRRHSCTQSQLATSVKRHSDLIPYLARGSLGTRARAPSTHVRRS